MACILSYYSYNRIVILVNTSICSVLMTKGDGRDMHHFAALRVQVRAAWPSRGQGKGTADDLLLGGQRTSAQPGTATDHGDTAGSRGGGHG